MHALKMFTKLTDARRYRIAVAAVVLLMAAANTAIGAGVDDLQEVNNKLCFVIGALGMFVLALLGLRFLSSDNPQERNAMKKGMIYVVLGLLVVALAYTLVYEIYCAIIKSAYGETLSKCTEISTLEACKP